MNTMKKLHNSVQSILSASRQINTYKIAIEELVYNSLDAEALSIAIRVNIDDNSIQVIDNGCGVAKRDFQLLGLRYTTSKFVDLNSLKSIPNKYGYKGQSLASIIEVSKNVKITSRCEDVDETWVKVFHEGKVKELSKNTQRPSKGTTVEVNGFLYNLNIQKNAINISEVNDVKSYLEQLALVHSNVSLSLRDDLKNEIVFKLHKNRDIYQTLSSLFGVEKTDVQVLKVEKNQYKVTAYIGKNKENNHQHWIYLNGKLVHNSKLNKVVNDNLTKALGLKSNDSKRKAKSKKTYYYEEEYLSAKKIPFYFMFLNCPYYDYDVNYGPKQSILEFKNWEPVNKLLEKLIKFYASDINIKESAKPIQNQIQIKEKDTETRDQVKKIIEKILNKNSKKLGVSQMQNGIRGKLIKRKTKKKTMAHNLANVLPLKTKEDTKIDNNAYDMHVRTVHLDCTDALETRALNEMVEKTIPAISMTKNRQSKINKNCKNEKKKHLEKNHKQPIDRKFKHSTKVIKGKPKNEIKNVINKGSKTISSNRPQTSKEIVKKNLKIKRTPYDPIIINFKKDTTSIRRRCNMLAIKANKLLTHKNKPKRQVFINETVQFSSIIRNNKNISVRKKVGEIIIHDYVPLPPRFNTNRHVWEGLNKNTYTSTYDLVRTILISQEKDNRIDANIKICSENPLPPIKPINNEPTELDSQNTPDFSRDTYASHNYVNVRNRIQENEDFDSRFKQPINKHFITKQSRENFIAKDKANFRNKFNSEIKDQYKIYKKPRVKKPTLGSMFNLFDNDEQNDTPYTIEFSKSNNDFKEQTIVTNGLVLFQKQNKFKNGTYTIKHDDNYMTQILPPSKTGDTYTVTSPEKYQTFDREDNLVINDGSKEKTDWYCSQRSINLQQSIHSIFFTQRYVENIASMRNGIQYTTNDNPNQNEKDVNAEVHLDNIDVSNNMDIEPLNICETILSNCDEKLDTNNHIPSWNDSLLNNLFEDSSGRCKDTIFNDEFDVNSLICDRNIYSNIYKEPEHIMGSDKAQNQFNDSLNPEVNKNVIGLEKQSHANYETIEEISAIQNNNETNENQMANLVEYAQITNSPANGPIGSKAKLTDYPINNFRFRNRHRFVPKGMSPIFQNNQSKHACDYALENDYYEKTIYKNFANNVQINSVIFEPGVQDVKGLATKEIETVNAKRNKDNASLIFTGASLIAAIVLGQVDDKFIAAKILGKSNKTQNTTEFLVLFDQHAVHERIRLENNLKDYFQSEKWKSITVDNILLKLSNDEILYLHNYEDKISKFGLQWTVLNKSEVLIHAIPEAVLGKNPRQVEVVIKAVRNLISEEINAIKSQKGCVTLYPKSIMDLVFSEACRYAIKFGDRLSRQACMELLTSLSECKTPFQCAHGRPVMAVLMELKGAHRKYEVKLSELHRFALSTKRRKK